MINKRILMIVLPLSLLATTCTGPFDHDDVKEFRVVGNYYISSINGLNSLLYKDSQSLSKQGSGGLVLDSLDSVAWEGKFIVATSNNKYYIFDTVVKRSIENHIGFESFQAAKQSLGLDKIRLRKISGTR